MNKVMLFVVVLVIGYATKAQTEQGNWLVSGGSTFSYSRTTSPGFAGQTNESTVINLETQFGHFVSDNLNLGAVVSFQRLTAGSTTQSDRLIGPALRYYASGQVFFGLTYLFSTTDFSDTNSSGSLSGEFLGIELGAPIWVTDSFAVEPAINYLMGQGVYDGFNTLAIGVGIGLYF